jgi:hypothetical protein
MLRRAKSLDPAQKRIKNWWECILEAKLPPPGASANLAIVAFFA